MGSEAPSWADQWGAGGFGDSNDRHHETKDSSGGKNKMANVKATASAGLGKAKVAAATGAQKLKSGTSMGIKWVKNQYQKRTSK